MSKMAPSGRGVKRGSHAPKSTRATSWSAVKRLTREVLPTPASPATSTSRPCALPTTKSRCSFSAASWSERSRSLPERGITDRAISWECLMLRFFSFRGGSVDRPPDRHYSRSAPKPRSRSVSWEGKQDENSRTVRRARGRGRVRRHAPNDCRQRRRRHHVDRARGGRPEWPPRGGLRPPGKPVRGRGWPVLRHRAGSVRRLTHGEGGQVQAHQQRGQP